MWPYLLYSLLLGGGVLLSYALSAYEAAYYSLPYSQRQRLQRRPNGLTQLWVRRFYANPELFLGMLTLTDLLANTLAVTSLVALLQPLLSAAWLPVAACAIALPLLLVVGEYMPRLQGAAWPQRTLQLLTLPLLPLYYLLYIPGLLLGRMARYRLHSQQPGQRSLNARQLKEAIQHTPDEESPREEKQVLMALVNLADTSVRSVMRGRVDIKALHLEATTEEALQAIRDYGHARIPVYEHSPDNITGIVYAKDLLPLLKTPQPWQPQVRKPLYVPETKMLNVLLRDFKQRRQHMAIVVDEYGGTSGLITLDDILEEIFGDIHDEGDGATHGYTRLADNAYVLPGRMPLVDVCRATGLPDDAFDYLPGENDTLAGLVLDVHGSLPPAGTQLTTGRFHLEVLAATDTYIQRVKLVIEETSEDEAKDED